MRSIDKLICVARAETAIVVQLFSAMPLRRLVQ